MNPITEAFRRLIPSKHYVKANGKTAFNCPACNDKKLRGAFWETPEGGFCYKCMNGGCAFQKTSGWEPHYGGLGKRIRFLFTRLGGDFDDLPAEAFHYKAFNRDPNLELEVATDFSEIRPPNGSDFIWRLSNKDALDCQRYVLSRGSLFVEHPFLWSEKYPRYVLYPLQYKNKVVGWIGRSIDTYTKPPHLKCVGFPSDYMLNQDIASRLDMVLVQEGVFDAIALRSLCTFGNILSRKQTNFLCRTKTYGKRVVLLPDYQKDEWLPYWQAAKEHGFYVCVPQWPNTGPGQDHIKDAGESIERNGLLRTVEAILEGITNDYFSARTLLEARSRGGSLNG